jgi:hypothetical protein
MFDTIYKNIIIMLIACTFVTFLDTSGTRPYMFRRQASKLPLKRTEL